MVKLILPVRTVSLYLEELIVGTIKFMSANEKLIYWAGNSSLGRASCLRSSPDQT